MTSLPLADLAELFLRFLMLSLLSIGGAMSTAPEMHRYLVVDRGWMNDADFTTAIALAQAAPGPNVLFVPVLGFQVAGVAGAAAALIGILLPSTLLSLGVSRWGSRRRDTPGVRAFTAGLAPVTVGLVFATGWLLSLPFVGEPAHRLGALALIVATMATTLKTRLAPIWMIAVGAVAGILGWV
ncbi:chromate transporter [Aromatoleum diolicum]|uniref:Chromate transporter n=1 Tax=Aromatoleum diolicum TaxID=75796 RepID=A0ABX1Q8X5_9RHOO|nr:chromate transporter [Aromatoleum diolicum]NMG74443.1 chromate transporter [Aromatoleum diolicum]